MEDALRGSSPLQGNTAASLSGLGKSKNELSDPRNDPSLVAKLYRHVTEMREARALEESHADDWKAALIRKSVPTTAMDKAVTPQASEMATISNPVPVTITNPVTDMVATPQQTAVENADLSKNNLVKILAALGLGGFGSFLAGTTTASGGYAGLLTGSTIAEGGGAAAGSSLLSSINPAAILALLLTKLLVGHTATSEEDIPTDIPTFGPSSEYKFITAGAMPTRGPSAPVTPISQDNSKVYNSNTFYITSNNVDEIIRRVKQELQMETKRFA